MEAIQNISNTPNTHLTASQLDYIHFIVDTLQLGLPKAAALGSSRKFGGDLKGPHFVAGSPGASVALRLLKERADSAEARAASATRQIAELKASLQVNQALWCLLVIVCCLPDIAHHGLFLPITCQMFPTMACSCPVPARCSHHGLFLPIMAWDGPLPPLHWLLLLALFAEHY